MKLIYLNLTRNPGGVESRKVVSAKSVRGFVETPGMPFSEADDAVKVKVIEQTGRLRDTRLSRDLGDLAGALDRS